VSTTRETTSQSNFNQLDKDAAQVGDGSLLNPRNILVWLIVLGIIILIFNPGLVAAIAH
jgi:hypothetical protein